MQLPSSPMSANARFLARVRTTQPLPMHTVRELLLLALVLACCTPFVVSLATGSGPLAELGPIRAHRFRGELTGFVVLGFVVAQLALSLGLRFARAGAPGLGRWRSLHRLMAVPLIAAVFLHTGGSAGTHMNRILLVAMMSMCVVAQIGHVFKARARSRLLSRRSPSAIDLDQEINGDRGWIHRSGHQLHIVLAVVVTVLVAVHIGLVYAF